MNDNRIKNFYDALKALTPKERLHVAHFMDPGGLADEGMFSPSVGEAIDRAEYDYSEDGEPFIFSIELGMCLRAVDIKILYENTAAEGEDQEFSFKGYEVLDD